MKIQTVKQVDQLTTRLVGAVRYMERRADGLGWMVNLTGTPLPVVYPCPIRVRIGQICELRGYPGKVLAEHVRPVLVGPK